ncbi:MAG: glycerophosphoryl diester phosphodiesterase [Corynebacterium sp.]|nr:glycerophosphoryl diester phosphodiesterase [Corynebacterium sp.]
MTFRVFAHRGLNHQAPENTLSAFRLAAEQSVQWIETDVDVLADGTAIVIHDETLDRTTDLSGDYAHLTATDLDPIDAGSWFSPEFAGEPLPTLDALVRLLNETGMHANIELKGPTGGKQHAERLITQVTQSLAALRPENQVLISSFNHVLLARFKEQAPQYPVACLFERHTFNSDWRTIAELVGASAIHPEDDGLTAEQIAMMRDAGYDVNVWTVNSRARINELKNFGATGVFNDQANLMLDFEEDANVV